MSLEHPPQGPRRKKLSWSTSQALGLAGLAAGAAWTGQQLRLKDYLALVNQHVLSPAAIAAIKEESLVDDDEVAQLEKRIAKFVLEQIRELQLRKRKDQGQI